MFAKQHAEVISMSDYLNIPIFGKYSHWLTRSRADGTQEHKDAMTICHNWYMRDYTSSLVGSTAAITLK